MCKELIIKNLLEILCFLMTGLFGGYFAFQKFKLKRIKQMLERDYLLRQKIYSLADDIITKNNYTNKVKNIDTLSLNQESLDAVIGDLKGFWTLSSASSPEIANLSGLLYHTVLYSRDELLNDQTGKLVERVGLWTFVANILEQIQKYSIKTAPSVNFWRVIYSFKKKRMFCEEISKLCIKTTSEIIEGVEFGVDVSGFREELLWFAERVNFQRNNALSSALCNLINLHEYLIRLVILEKYYFPPKIRVYIHGGYVKTHNTIGSRYMIFNLVRYESKIIELVNNRETVKFYFLSENNWGGLEHGETFFKPRKDCYEIFDESANQVVMVKRELIHISSDTSHKPALLVFELESLEAERLHFDYGSLVDKYVAVKNVKSGY